MNSLNRKLGSSEKLFDILHDLSDTILVNVARIEGLIIPEMLQQALDLVQKRHPMLQVHIVESADGPDFQSEDTPEIPLRVIDKQHENHWIEIAQEELYQKFPGGTTPLCRVTFLRACKSNGISEIIATFHHAITDGLSCMHFIHELLSYCQQIAAGEHIPEVLTMQLLPPLENLLESCLTQKNNIEDAQEKPSQEIQQPKLIIEEEAPPSERRTRLMTRAIGKEMTLMLINRCKEEKTTVYGALGAAMLFESAKIAFTEIPIHLSCASNVNLRKYCEPEVNDDYIGFFASRVQIIHTLVKDTNFWDLARECKAKISHSISCRVPQTIICSDNLRRIDKNFIIKISEHQMGRENTIHVSNLGRFKFFDKYGDLELKEVYFAGGGHLVGCCFWLGVVTFHEQLFCSFSHVVPLVSVKTAELFADSVIATMQKACLYPSVTLTK